MVGAASALDLVLYCFLYAFLGWVAEVGYYAIVRRRFCNRGFLTLPFLLSYGVTFDLMIEVLPTLDGRPVLQYLFILAAATVVESLSQLLHSRIGPQLHWEPERSRLVTGNLRGALVSAAIAGAYFVAYLVIHPLLLALFTLTPQLVKEIVAIVLLALLAADCFVMGYAIHRGDPTIYLRQQEKSTQRTIGNRITAGIWRRLQKAYPGIRTKTAEEQEEYTFAKGICIEKLIWVFLICALLGDLIETVYCSVTGGVWMNRSSVLYGPFSFVWGLGAVVLTVTLQYLAEKPDRHVFAAGFFIGGAYEYLCSVFTELVFGTVFWDYSWMPLNIDGRTNVLYCCFWGILAVVWVKILYPRLDRIIEKLPALAGTVATWVIVIAMACNAGLTCTAMVRYDTRADQPEPSNKFEEFLDRQYDDEFMEERWPNMKVT